MDKLLKRRSILLTFFLIAFTCLSSGYASKWDLEYWQYFNCKNMECCSFKLYTTGLIRLNKDISRFYYYRITENFAYQALSWLDLEAHYSFLYSKPRGALRFTTKNRLEFEVNPTFCFGNCATLQWRNRLEIIKRQHISQLTYRLRDRLMVKVPVQYCGKLCSLNFYDEIFYNFNLKKFTENRFVPIEMSFILCEQINIDVFFMIRNFFRTDRWYNSFVLGTQLEF